MPLSVNVNSGGLSEDINFCALYDGEVTSESEVKGSILENINCIISGDISSVPKSILISDEGSIDRIAAFIELLIYRE